MPALELPGVESSLAKASERAARYEWMKAAETYRLVLGELEKTKDSERMASVSGLLADSYFKAAFQTGTRTEFQHNMRLSEKAHLDSASLYKAAGSDAKSKRAEAKALFANFWTLDEPVEKRRVLDRGIQLAQESAQDFELHGDKASLPEIFRDLVVYREKAVQYSVDRNPLVDHFEKALEDCWRILDEFHGLASEQTELETINVLARLYVYAESVIERPRYEELEKKLAKFTDRISQLSSKTRTASELALSSEAASILAADLEGNIPKALESFETRVSKAKEIGDRYLLGRLFTIASAWIRFSGLTEEYAEKRRERLNAALEYAMAGIQYLQPVSPGVWLKYAYKRYTDVSTLLALNVETDLEKKRAILRKAINTAKEGLAYDNPSFVPGIGHELSKAMYFLADMDTGPEEKSLLLQEAIPIREETVRIVSQLSPHSWNRGVMLNYLALLKAELSKIENNNTVKIQLLNQAASNMQQCIQICSQQLASYPHFVRVLAQYNEWHGDVLEELYQATQDVSIARQSITAYHEATVLLAKSGTIGPIPGVRWKISQTYDSLKEFAESSESFRKAAHEHREVAKKVEPLASVFEELAQYMEAWAIIEEARLNHEREQYTAAAESYTKVSEHLRTVRPWSHLSSHYSACSFLELGEAMSRQERQQSAIESFNSAQRSFQNAKAQLESMTSSVPPQEKKELVSWLEITSGRLKYSSGRLQLEEAKVLDARMEEEASAAKYKAASDSFRTLLNKTNNPSTRAELETLSVLCEAWAKLKSAETSASPELYAEAAKSFMLAETKASGKKMKLSAIANASMCKALEYGSMFRRTRDIQLYQEIKKNLETAADFYEEAGIKKAADWTRATQRFFDALRYLRDAETEPDAKKRPELFSLAENHLRLAATIYGEAGYAKKKQEALRHLERAKEEKQLLLMPVEILEESPAVSDVTISPVSLLEDRAAGLEKLRSAHIRGMIAVSNTELNAGDKLTADLQIVNIGKEPATLDRLENLLPEGLELASEGAPYSANDRSINLRGKRLEHLKSHQLKVVVRARRKGKYLLKPKVTYFDDKGIAGAYEFEPKSLSVKEIGVMGWIRGPS